MNYGAIVGFGAETAGRVLLQGGPSMLTVLRIGGNFEMRMGGTARILTQNSSNWIFPYRAVEQY